MTKNRSHKRIQKEPVMKLFAWIILGIILGLGVTSLLRADRDSEPGKLAKLRKAKVEAARRTYEVTWKNYRDGLAPPVELPYRWSCRWLKAERELSQEKAEQVAACKAHLERMREMERIERELRRSKLNPVNEVTAAEYYRIEAEVWLTEAQEAAAK
jgi:hypothetical protein